MADPTNKRKGKMPADVSKLTGDDVMRKVFGKRTAEELKKAAHEKDGDNEKPE
jgi:hypothetical protein